MRKPEKSKREKKVLVVLAGAQKHLKDVYCWPEDGQKLKIRNIVIPLIMVYLPLAVGGSGHIYQSFVSSNILAAVNDLCYMGITGSLFLCGIIYINLIENLVELVKKLNKNKYGKPRNLERIKEKLEKITFCFHIYITVAAIILIILAYFMDQECFSRKKQGELPGYVCGMVFSFWYPIELGYTPWQQIIWICNVIIAVICLPKLCSAVVLYYGCLHITINRMNHLTNSLRKIAFVDRKVNLMNQELIFYVKYYSEIVQLVNDINSTVGLILAPYQNILSILVISLMEYQTIVGKNALGLLTLFGWLLVQAVACYEGQRLENSSDALREKVYDLPWYDLHPSMRTNFRMFHIQTQKTLNFKISPIIVMNLVHFHKVMKGSYSLMMYLKDM